jgi:hypothetical protein
MAWTSATTDRTKADIVARTTKAFFNAADYYRIKDNTAAVRAQILSLLGVAVAQNTLTYAAFPYASTINTFVENIDRLRVVAALPDATGILALNYNYQAGPGAIAPDYISVNAWENALYLIHVYLPYIVDYQVSCGVANAGQDRFWQARFRG